jgi:UDP-GlcNAc:undecaprenyl-phosphate GlcNAc-1-phosphate transferase
VNCDDLTATVRWAAALELLLQALPALVVAFLVTVIAVPIARAVAHRAGVVDKPDAVRKFHGRTVAYMGGVGVFLGVFAGIIGGVIFAGPRLSELPAVPLSIILGMIAITFTGLADDIFKFDARLKIAGQLVAAAALALDDIGVNVAVGVLAPLMGGPEEHFIHLGSFAIQNAAIFYWVGTALVAAFVLGGCNAANLIDGLDGLLSGVTAIMCIGLLALSLAIVFALPPDPGNLEHTAHSMAGARIVLCLALFGACCGFLCFNFNPASIFLGDAGSLLLGFLSVTIIMTFANLQPYSCPWVDRSGLNLTDAVLNPAPVVTGARTLGYQGYPTLLVMSGLAMFGLPILDTSLALIRRRRAGVSMSTADANHLHHRLKRRMGGSVRKAVLMLYSMEVVLLVIGTGAGLYLLLVGGSLRVPFIALIVAFLAALALAMRGSTGQPPGNGTKHPAT